MPGSTDTPSPRSPPPPAGSGTTASTGSVMGAMVDTPSSDSRSNSQGRRSVSVASVSSSDPSGTWSPPNIDGSNSSSWATQSASSSRQVGGMIPEPASAPSSPESRARTAGTWPVAGSVQWGSSVVGGPLGTAVPPGATGSIAWDGCAWSPGGAVNRTLGFPPSNSSPSRSASPSGSTSGPLSSSLGSRDSPGTTGSSEVLSPAGSAPTIRTRSVAGPDGSGRVTGTSVRVRSSSR